MESRKNVTLIIPSDIIATGLSSILSAHSEFFVKENLHEYSRATEARLRTLQCDLLIVDPIVFDFRTAFHFKPHAHENLLDFPQRELYGMQMAAVTMTAGQRDIDTLGSHLFLELTCLEKLHLFVQTGFDTGPHFVDHLADLRPFLSGNGTEPAEDLRQGPFLSQILDPDILQILDILDFAKILAYFFTQFLQLIVHTNAS